MCMKFLKKKFMLAGWTFLLGAGIFIFSENVAFADTGDLEVVTSAGISTVLSEAVLSTQGNEGATLADYDYDSLGIISLSSGSLNVRKEASTDSELVGNMKDGTALEIISVDGEWIKMSSGDVNGYVKSEYVLKQLRNAGRLGDGPRSGRTGGSGGNRAGCPHEPRTAQTVERHGKSDYRNG